MKWKHLIFGLTNLAALALPAADRGFVASGSVTSIAFSQGGNEFLEFTNTFDFHVFVDGTWRLDLVDAAGVPAVLSFDGQDCFYLRDEGEKPSRTIPGLDRPVGRSPGYVSSGPLPLAPIYANDARHVLWLAFAAGSFLSESNVTSLPLLWRVPRTSLEAYGFKLEPELEGTRLATLKSATFVRDTQLDLDVESEFDRLQLDAPRNEAEWQSVYESLEARKQHWPHGFVAAKFHVSESVNRDGFLIPLRFSLEMFNRYWTNSPRQKLVGEVSRYETVDGGVDLQPAIKYETSLVDSRVRARNYLRAVNDVVYSANAGQSWPASDSLHVKGQFQQKWTGNKRYSYHQERIKRVSFYAALGLAALIFPYVLYRTRVRRMEARGTNTKP
jgi:hypothetical protein